MELKIETDADPNYTWTEQIHQQRLSAKSKQLQDVMQRMLVEFNRVRPIQNRLDSETFNSIIQPELDGNGLEIGL